jgi:4'-phosphopantetheinyl transferase
VSTSKRVEDPRASELGLELWLLQGDGDLREEVHAELRRLLGERLGMAADELEFVREPCPLCGELHGRPAIKSNRIHFSIARRPGVALIGIARRPVGVDVEVVAADGTADDVEPLLHPGERDELHDAPAAERPRAFARIWTRKEAYLKGIGAGVTGDLARDYVGIENRAAGPEGWIVIEVPAPDGFAAAAAVAVNRPG